MTSEIRTEFRVVPADLDLYFHMNNAKYLNAMELARWDVAGKTGMLRAMLKKRWYVIAANIEITYLKSLQPFQKYAIRSQLDSWDEKWFIVRHLFEADGKIYAIGKVRKVILDEKRRTVPMSEVLRASGQGGLESPTPSESVRIWSENLQFTKKNFPGASP